jgi:hypothetical protein
MSTASFSLLQGDPSTWGVPPVGKTFVGINAAGQLVLKQNDGSISPVLSFIPANQQLVNAFGATDIVPPALITSTYLLISGTARTVPVSLKTAGIVDGQILRLRLTFPALDNLIVNIYNENTGGTLLSSFQSATGSGITNGLWTFVAGGGVWALDSNQVPAIS